MYKKFKIDIYEINNEFEARVNSDNSEEEYFKFTHNSNKTTISNLNSTRDDIIQTIILKVVLLPENISKDDSDGGVYIKSKSDRIMGDPWWPSKMRKNENSIIRASLEYENYKDNELIQPGVNKSNRIVHNFINYITHYYVKTVRDSVAKKVSLIDIISKEDHIRELKSPFLERIDEYKTEFPELDYNSNISFSSELNDIKEETNRLDEIVNKLKIKKHI